MAFDGRFPVFWAKVASNFIRPGDLTSSRSILAELYAGFAKRECLFLSKEAEMHPNDSV